MPSPGPEWHTPARPAESSPEREGRWRGAESSVFTVRCCLAVVLAPVVLRRWGLREKSSRGGHFRHFFNNKKWICAFFIKLIWLGVGCLNRTGAEIGYYINLIKNAKKSFFIIEKIQKIPKCPALEKTEHLALTRNLKSITNFGNFNSPSQNLVISRVLNLCRRN